MHFKMNSFDELVTPGCYMSSIDLKDAYFTVLIPPKDRKYLCFFWQGKVSVLLPAFWFISSTKNFLQNNETPTTVLRQKDHELDVYTTGIAKGPGDHI